MSRLLNLAREFLGPAPRDPARLPRGPLPLGRSEDRLLESRHQATRALLEGGTLVWGVVVHAPDSLFAPGSDDGQGRVVVDAAPSPADDLLGLVRVANLVRGLIQAGTLAEPLATFQRNLLSPHPEKAVVPVPLPLTRGSPVAVLNVDIHRRDLPAKHLITPVVPLLVASPMTEALVLPHSLWAPRLVEGWWALGASEAPGSPGYASSR